MNEWIKINLPFNNYENDNSFYGKGLAKPGTLIKIDNKEYLIGHINEAGGICDCCEFFDGETVIESYKIVWRKE